MALVAVLSARSTTEPGAGMRRRGELTFAGQSLIEYQARQAHAAGAGHVLMLVDDISPLLTGAIDRLAADGIHATLIRDLPTMGRMIGSSDRILLIGDGHILPRSHINLLAESEAARILVLPATQATAAFERIDGDQTWAGALVVPALTLLRLVDMLGDWDLPLTLLRQTVQEEAQRTLCDMTDIYDGQIVIATDQIVADTATQALARTRDRVGTQPGDLDDWPIGRPAAMLAPMVVRHEIAPATLRHIALGISLLGLVAILGGVPALGFILCFVGLVADRVAAQLDRLLRLAVGLRLIDHAVGVIVLAAILAAGLLHGGDGPLAGAGAIIFVGIMALGQPLRQRGWAINVPEMLKFAPGAALLLLVLGTLSGMLPMMFAICALLAFASHANQLLRS